MAISVCTIMFIKRGNAEARDQAGAIVKDDLVTSASARERAQLTALARLGA